ncbi:MAG: TonB-dependent receptor [Nitrospinae bacterium]|nr:TonB-dependent receptor [Nitrospinota bacterium]
MRVLVKKAGACFILAFTLLSANVWGEEMVLASNNIADLSLEELGQITVVTASLFSEQTAQAPAPMLVITRKQILDRGYRNLEDLMRDLPGFAIQNHDGLRDNIIAVRGVTGNNKLLILMDGIRISAATSSPEVPVRDNFPLYNAKQVEILYGPASALYGADAFNGVINIITRDGAGTDGLSAAVETGEHGYNRAEVFGGKRFSDRVALTVGGHFHDSKNPDLSQKFPDEFTMTDLTVGSTVVKTAAQRGGYKTPNRGYSTYARLELGESMNFGWRQSYWEVASSSDGKPAKFDFDGSPFIGHQMTTLYGTWHGHVTEGVEGNAEASYSLYEIVPTSKFINSSSNFTDAYKYEKGERLHIEPRVTWSGGKSVVTAGILAEWFSSIPLTPNLTYPYNTGASASAQQNQYYPGTSNTLPIKFWQLYYQNQGAYLQWRYSVTDALNATLGVRAENNSDYGSTVNPRLGIVYQATPSTSVKAMVGQAFLAPAPMTVYRHFGSFSGTTNSAGLYTSSFFRIPNLNLKPEKVTNFDLGFESAPTPAFNLQMNTFYSQVSDLTLVQPTPTVQTGYIPGGAISYTEFHDNIGDMSAYGLDLSANYRPRPFGDALDLWVNFFYVNGQLKNKSNGLVAPLPHTSNYSTNLGATYTYDNRLIVTPSLRWIGPTNTYVESPTSADMGKTAPSYVDVSLYGEYKIIKDRLSVFTRITNVFDEKIYHVSIGFANEYTLSPQDPRWVMVGLRYQF